MIGAFARRLGTKDAATEVEVEDRAWRYRAASGEVLTDADPDAVPAAFAETIETEGGRVVVSPLVDALLRALRVR